MKRTTGARGSLPARALLAAMAAAAAVGAAASIPGGAGAQAGPAGSPVLQMWPVPSTMLPSGSGAVTNSALAPASDGAGEEVIVSGPSGGAVALEVSLLGQFSQSSTTGQLGSGPFVAMVNAHSLDWALSSGGLYAIGGPSTTPQQFPVPNGSFTDMALGLDGHLYLADSNGNVDQCEISSSPSAGCGATYPISSNFQTPQPAAIAAAGAELWFTTAAAELGWVSTQGAQGGPYGDTTDSSGNTVGPVSALAHSIVLGVNGYLFAIGSTTDPSTGIITPNSTIAEVDPRVGPRVQNTGSVVTTYNLGLLPGTTLSSLTTGPDGDLWFTEETASGRAAIGRLDPTTGIVTSSALPSGYVLPGAGSDAIEPGPVGSYTVWFAAETTGSPGEPATGEIANLGGTTPGTGTTSTGRTTMLPTSPPPTTTATTTTTTGTAPNAPGRLRIAPTATVSRHGSASVSLRCTGAGSRTCTGTLALTVVVSRTVITGAKGHRRHQRQRMTLTLGSAPYKLDTTHSASVAVKLSISGITMLTTAHGHRLRVRALVTPSGGRATSASLTLIGHPQPTLRR